MPHSKRLNPTTGEIFKKGFAREDGMIFDGYQTSVLRKKTGYCKELWRSPASYQKWSIDYQKESKKKIYNFISKLMNDEKTKSGCQHCGYNEDPVALDFHHINREDKLLNVSRHWRTSLKQFEKMKKEWKKCIVLCAICHIIEEKRIRNEN